MKKILFILFLCQISFFAQWKWKNPVTTSITINKIRPVNENVYVGVGNRGLTILSMDRGETWTKIESNVNTDLYAMTIINNTIWALGSEHYSDANTILKSEDGGKSWKVASVINNYPDLVEDLESLYKIQFVNEKVGYICGRLRDFGISYGRIYKTTDGGLSWVRKFDELDFYIYTMSWINENTGWFKNQNTIYKTTDGAESFTNLDSKNLLYYDESELIFFDDMHGMHSGYPSAVTEDGGKTWNNYMDYFEYNKDVSSLFSSDCYFFDNKNGCLVYDSSTLRFLITNDGGKTWTKKKYPPYNFSFSDGSIYRDMRTGFINPDGTAVLAGHMGDIYKYSNNLDSINYKVTNFTRRNLSSVKFIDSNNGWIAGEEQLLKTQDGGANWEVISSPQYRFEDLHFFDKLNGIGIGRIKYFDHAINDTLMDYGFVSTADGGLTWKTDLLMWRDLTKYGYIPKKILFNNKLNGIIYSYTNEYFSTDDGGKNWKLNSIDFGKIGEAQYFSKDKIYFVGSANGNPIGTAMFFKTEDGGKTYTSKIIENAFVDLTTMYFANEMVGFAAGGYYLYKTTDGGVTWSNIFINRGEIFDIYFSNENNGWMLCHTGLILKTEDGGNSWHQQTGANNVGFADFPITNFCFTDENHAVAVGWWGSIIYTDNGGISTDIKSENTELFKDYELSQNYPNPFNPSTVIKYHIPKACSVELKVYDMLGREVSTLVNEYKNAGSYSVEFLDGKTRLSSGVYFYRLTAGNYFAAKKMILIK